MHEYALCILQMVGRRIREEMKYSENIENFLNFMRESQKEYNIAVSEEKEKNDETQDLLHHSELHDDIPCDELAIFQAMKQTRRDRRTAKDTIKLASHILDWVKEYPKAAKGLEKVLGNVRKDETHIENRYYTPKTDIVERTLGRRE